MTEFIKRHADKILGVLTCFDRVVITGTIPGIGYAEGMTRFLTSKEIRIFDYPRWAEPLREEIRENAERLAKENGIEIEFVRNHKLVRKEKLVAEKLRQRGDQPGLVHILSAMESCPSYQPWHDKNTHQTFLKPKDAKCLHYYFYFIDKHLGLCYMRVPTWAPFRLQFYYNGHSELANNLTRNKIDFTLVDNAFARIADFQKAQKIADSIDPAGLHTLLDKFARTYCPPIKHLGADYHWSLMQVEYATDIIFKDPSDLHTLYEDLVRTAVHAVKADNVATFLGRNLTASYQGELGNNFHTRIEGTRIKHHMGVVAVKMYDKHGFILRIETVANDVSFFKHYREVVQRDGSSHMKFAPVKKSIHSLPALMDIMRAANRRYVEFLSAIDDPTSSIQDLDKISRPARDQHCTWRGFNLFHGDDLELFCTISRGEFAITGFRNADLRQHLATHNSHRVSRALKRLRTHGIIKKVAHGYKYHFTSFGRRITVMALKLRDMAIIPLLRGNLMPSPQLS